MESIFDQQEVLVPLAFVLGAIIGSFANSIAYRLPRGISLVKPRSGCPHCDSPIASYDNIPILSWLILRGRCRRCGKPIPPRYLLLELATATLFALYALVTGFSTELAVGLPFIALMATVAVIDIESRVVPNKLMATATLYILALSLAIDAGHLPQQLIAALAAGGFLLLVALIYPAGMGMGDVKLAAVMGLYLGKAVAVAMLVGFAVGAIYGIALIVKEGRSARKKAVPFAPFLAAGAIFGLFYGTEIMDWYTGTYF